MKTIYSLKEFREQVLEIAKLVNETYVTVSVEINAHEKFEFRCYVNKNGLHIGKTMEEALSKLKEQIAPLPPQNVDVEIEMDITEEQHEKAIEELREFHSEPSN